MGDISYWRPEISTLLSINYFYVPLIHILILVKKNVLEPN